MTRIAAVWAALIAAIVIPAAFGAYAQSSAASIEVRVWERADDPSRNFVSARVSGGSWATLGTIPVALDSASGAYRYGDIELRTDAGLAQVRVWERAADPARNFISARIKGGSWRTLGTIPLGEAPASAYQASASGRYRYSDITLTVGTSATPTPIPTPWSSTTAGQVCRFSDTLARVVGSTVKVTTPSGVGTAFYVGGGQFVTAGHVVDDRPRSITLSNRRVRVSARLVGFYSSTNGDVALLSASASGLQPLGWAGTLPLGAPIAVLGYPEGLGVSASITRGYVSRQFQQGGVSWIQTDAAVSPGNSGGPLVDPCGRIAGVISGSHIGERGSEGLHFAVAEPTMSRKLIALGLRGYAVTPPGEYPEPEYVPPRATPTPVPRATPVPRTTCDHQWIAEHAARLAQSEVDAINARNEQIRQEQERDRERARQGGSRGFYAPILTPNYAAIYEKHERQLRERYC